jgi:hypothetical protein
VRAVLVVGADGRKANDPRLRRPRRGGRRRTCTGDPELLAYSTRGRAANILVRPLRESTVSIRDPAGIQCKREIRKRLTQRVQAAIRQQVGGNDESGSRRLPCRYGCWSTTIPLRLRGRFIGIRPEHMKTDDVFIRSGASSNSEGESEILKRHRQFVTPRQLPGRRTLWADTPLRKAPTIVNSGLDYGIPACLTLCQI